MSTWMVIVSVWMMFAFCVVLFVRGASAQVDRPESEDELAPARAKPSHH